MSKIIDPLDQVDMSETHHEILFRRSRGETPTEIAAAMFSDRSKSAGIQMVFRCVREAVDAFHQGIQDIVREKFVVAAERMEQLYQLVQIQISKMLTSGEFSEAVIRSAIMILDRQAKLYGFDMCKGDTSADRTKWLAEAPTQDIVKVAKDYGITIPDGAKFTT